MKMLFLSDYEGMLFNIYSKGSETRLKVGFIWRSHCKSQKNTIVYIKTALKEF